MDGGGLTDSEDFESDLIGEHETMIRNIANLHVICFVLSTFDVSHSEVGKMFFFFV